MLTEAQLFWRQVDAWSRPPVGGTNMSPLEILACDQEALGKFVYHATTEHWAQPRAANIRKALRMDDTHGLDVLDYGCGFGMDALVYAERGNTVSLADISPLNLAAARSVLRARNYEPDSLHLVTRYAPCLENFIFDVIHANGVLHHIENAPAIFADLAKRLKPGGEMRLMLYSEESWRLATGNDLPNVKTFEHPLFATYVRAMDATGFYAEWYDEGKAAALAEGTRLKLKDRTLIGPDNIFSCAVYS